MHCKQCFFALALAAALALPLAGCSFRDVMLYLYGGDEWVEQDKDPVWARCDADNGVTVVYDTNRWQQPVMAQEDTVSLTAGNQLDYTVVLLQVTDSYTDFLAQSGEELAAETNVVPQELTLTLPQAEAEAALYDCGSYQTLFAELTYPGGEKIYVTAATRTSDYSPITALLEQVYPTGQTPESAIDAPAVSPANGTAQSGEKQKSYA